MPILIKRYANRKLYNTQSSRYITLKGIAELLERGEEVRVIDNESGEDITKVALSQILVDESRSNHEPSTSLLTQIMERGGDVLYDVLKKGVDDATDNIDEIQDRFRNIIQGENGKRSRGSAPKNSARREGTETEANSPDDQYGSDQRDNHEDRDKNKSGGRRGLGDWIAYASPDFDSAIHTAVERVFKVLDLPRRKDVDALNQNLERVANAIEDLQRSIQDSGSHDD
jgi:polyhydroxyalkanoate synthesis repressor PhaR